MSKRNKAALQAFALLVLVGLLIWQTIYWQSTGMYVRMYDLVTTGRGYLTVLYNVGLMVVTGMILGILPGVIANLFARQERPASAENKNSDRRSRE